MYILTNVLVDTDDNAKSGVSTQVFLNIEDAENAYADLVVGTTELGYEYTSMDMFECSLILNNEIVLITLEEVSIEI